MQSVFIYVLNPFRKNNIVHLHVMVWTKCSESKNPSWASSIVGPSGSPGDRMGLMKALITSRDIHEVWSRPSLPCLAGIDKSIERSFLSCHGLLPAGFQWCRVSKIMVWWGLTPGGSNNNAPIGWFGAKTAWNSRIRAIFRRCTQYLDKVDKYRLVHLCVEDMKHQLQRKKQRSNTSLARHISSHRQQQQQQQQQKQQQQQQQQQHQQHQHQHQQQQQQQQQQQNETIPPGPTPPLLNHTTCR